MTQIIIDVNDEIEKQVELFKAVNSLASKSIAIEEMLKLYVKENRINIK